MKQKRKKNSNKAIKSNDCKETTGEDFDEIDFDNLLKDDLEFGEKNNSEYLEEKNTTTENDFEDFDCSTPSYSSIKTQRCLPVYQNEYKEPPRIHNYYSNPYKSVKNTTSFTINVSPQSSPEKKRTTLPIKRSHIDLGLEAITTQFFINGCHHLVWPKVIGKIDVTIESREILFKLTTPLLPDEFVTRFFGKK